VTFSKRVVKPVVPSERAIGEGLAEPHAATATPRARVPAMTAMAGRRVVRIVALLDPGREWLPVSGPKPRPAPFRRA
jgi:hypothetical protein